MRVNSSPELSLSTYIFKTGDIEVKPTNGGKTLSTIQVICSRKTVTSESAFIIPLPSQASQKLVVKTAMENAKASVYPEILGLPAIPKLAIILADNVPKLMEYVKTDTDTESTFNILLDLVYPKEKDQMFNATNAAVGQSKAFSSFNTHDSPLDENALCEAMYKATSGKSLTSDQPVHQLIGKVVGFIMKDFLLGLGKRLEKVYNKEQNCWKIAYYILDCLRDDLEARANQPLKESIKKVEKYIKKLDSNLIPPKIKKLTKVYKDMVCA